MSEPFRVQLTKAVKLPSPPKLMFHGEAGVGKTTICANAPGVIIIPCEAGSNEIEVRRARVATAQGQRDPQTWEEFTTILMSLVTLAETQKDEGFKWLCIDTVDALERMIHEQVAKENGKTSIEGIGYAKGYIFAVDKLREVLAKLERLQRAGVGTLLIAHSVVQKFNNPEGADFDYWDIKCHKKFAGMLVEWCDGVLFAKREQYASTTKGSTKVLGVSSQVRYLYTQKTASFVAKNRFDLPEKLPMSWYELARGMAAHKPANPTLMREAARELIARLPTDSQEKATAALEAIHPEDARQLAQFLDYAKSKVQTETVTIEEETPNE